MRRVLVELGVGDVARWPVLVHGGRLEASLTCPDGYHDPHTGAHPKGPERIDQATNGAATVAVIHGNPGGPRRVRNDTSRAVTLHVLRPTNSGVASNVLRVAAGQAVEVTYGTGRLLVALPA